MANVRKRISELTALNSASLDTVIVGVDNGTTYKIELDVLADAVTSRVNILDRDRLESLESVTSFFETKGRSIISSSAQITGLGFISTSVDITSLNSFTQSQNTTNTSLSNSIATRLQTSSFNDFSASVNQRILDATNEQNLSNLATTGSNTFIGNQKITGSVSILIPGGTAYAMNENPTPNNEFWAYVVQYPDAQNVAVGWTASIVGGSTYTVTAVNYQHPFNKIILSDGSLAMGYRIGINFSKSSKLWEFNSNGTLTGLPDGLVSGSSQFTSSYDERYVLSGSITQTTWDNIANKPSGIVSQSTDLTSLNNFTASISTASLVNRLNAIENVSGSWITESETGSFLTSLPSNLVSSSAQITAFGFISSSTTINTSSFATTGSNSFSGSQTITGSLIVSSVAVVAGAVTIPSASVISLTSGSSISVDASGAITGSLTGSVFGIGDVVAFSASLNSRIISGSAVAGTISGSSQLTSSYDSRYSLSGSILTSFSSSVDSRLDTLETTIISGSPNYTQILGNKISNITTTGVIIISGSITTTGNPIQIMVTGDANPTSTGWCRLQIYRGESAIGNIIQVENESNQNVPYCLNIIDTPSAGTYTYSMRTVSGISGTFEFGEASGPLLTAVELKTNTNLPSTNNTFTGTNIFTGTTTLRGGVNIGTGSGDEGGEIQLALPQTNTTLTGSVVVDVWRDRVRIFEAGGNNRGAYLNMTSQSVAVGSSIVTSPNLLTIQTITSASYASLTPISGTLYIIIG